MLYLKYTGMEIFTNIKIINYNSSESSRGSSVGTATGYGLDDLGV
jgi:hypothetical protein